ncbi:hypothetical protein [Deinococcus sp. RIT780]|uniref:hypothetical protein n=1 Tax=Deinococcus sp. RIT780 TaxID=2870472 RepID=UPI001C89B1F7|nr:hypothetical protein [Deinococcus sp. RIT780]MBX8465009.1 hypothetical protein [Deinococcus sp. RIT780]
MRRSTAWPTREELYELVWARPSEQVAAELGVSGVALAKRCTALNIPKPPRGYWAKRVAGQKVKKPPLPVSSRPKQKSAAPRAPYVAAQVHSEVPWPSLVQATDRGYRDAHVDVWGRLERPGRGQVLDVMVSREVLPRALQLYALIIHGLKRSPVALLTEKGRTLARAGRDEIRLRIKEQVQARNGLPPIEPKYASSWNSPKPQKAVGTGRLQLLMSIPWQYGFGDYAVQFRDGKVPLEEQLESILVYLQGVPLRAAEEREASRQQDEARLAEQRRREEEQARLAALQAERERRRQETSACREGLHDLARQWEDMERLRDYLAALDRGLLEPESVGAEEYREWRLWTGQQLEEVPRRQAAQIRSWATRVQEMKWWEPLE